MKKYLLLLLLPVSVFAATDNYFCPSKGSLSFTYNSYAITKNQSWDGISTKTKNNVGCVLIKANRKSSDFVLNWVEANTYFNVDQYNTLSTVEQISKTTKKCINGCAPSDLNFATKGTLRIAGLNSSNPTETVDCDNVILTQGSFQPNGISGSYTTNNWIVTNYNGGSDNITLDCKVVGTYQEVEVKVTRNTGKNAAETFNYEIVKRY